MAFHFSVRADGLLTFRSGLMASHFSVRPDGFRWREMERETHIVKLRGQGEEGQEGVEPSWRQSFSIGGLLGAMRLIGRLGGIFRVLLGHLGNLLGLFGGSWGSLGALLGRLGALLGLFGGV